uniref:Cysteine and tyrosine-rich protein 1 n=1 Tax=Biomphalaria glabrata TaxID=6526 RepID=A0A2C9L2E1_BIOGL
MNKCNLQIIQHYPINALPLECVIGEYCTKASYSSYSSFFYQPTTTFYCSFGCCGASLNEYCCIANVGYIIGIVIGCIAGVAIIVSIICCCIKKSQYKGRVVQPTVVGGHPAMISVQNQNQMSSSNGPYPPMAYSNTYGVYPPPTFGNPYDRYNMPPPYPPQPPLDVQAPPPPFNGYAPAYDTAQAKQPFMEGAPYSHPASNPHN